MSKKNVALNLIGVALVLASCTTANNQTGPDPTAMPVSATRHGTRHADAHYALGRYYQGQIRYDQAIRSYREVLEAQPDHAEARNALGVIHAIQGQHGMAEQELRTALGLAPNSAHLHNNLGYALLLQGRVAEAIPAFEEALRLEPGQARAAHNLRVASARLEGHPGSVPAALSPVQTAEALTFPVSAPAVMEAEPSVRMIPVTANVYELQLPAPPRTENRSASPPPARQRPVRLEVTNGNGVEGLARRTSDYLKEMGYSPARLTNQKPFVQSRTEIQFRPGFEQQALGLQAALAGKGVMAQSSQMRQDIQVRVILGRDLRTTAQLAEIEAGSPLRLARRGE